MPRRRQKGSLNLLIEIPEVQAICASDPVTFRFARGHFLTRAEPLGNWHDIQYLVAGFKGKSVNLAHMYDID